MIGTLLPLLFAAGFVTYSGVTWWIYRELQQDIAENETSPFKTWDRGQVLKFAAKQAPRTIWAYTGPILANVRNGLWAAVTGGVSGLWQRRRGEDDGPQLNPQRLTPRRPEATGSGGGRAPVAATPDTVREVPSLREDPTFAPPDAQLVANQDVPPMFVQMAMTLAGFVPENEAEEMRMLRGWAAGFLHVGQAFAAHADNMTAQWNMPPAFIAGVLETGEHVGDLSLLLAAANNRLVQIYRGTRLAVADGTPLPKNAAEWFEDGTHAA